MKPTTTAIDPADTGAVETHLKPIATDPEASFGRTIAERYLSQWGPNREKNLALLKTLDEVIEKDRQPVAHRFRLSPAQESDPRLHADGYGWRLDKATLTDPKRPRVLLIGDSILNGYLKDVTAALKGSVYIDDWVTPTNQADKSLTRKIKEILANGPYDVVHFNLGLHGFQIGRISGGEFKPLTRAMVTAIREHDPKAKLIWASTTPITVKDKPTELDPENNPVIVEHNRLAAKVMK